MRKRLRKKRHLGEFQEFGFEVRIVWVDHLTEKQEDDAIDSFTLEAVEANRLYCGGGGRRGQWGVFATSAKRPGATEEQRRAVEHWLSQCPAVKEFKVGPLVDAWYGPFE